MRTEEQCRNDVLASNLFFGFWAFSLMAEIVRTKVLHAAVMSPVVTIVCIYVAYVGLYYGIWLGKRWAKVTLAILLVLAVIQSIAQQLVGYSLLEAAHAQDYIYLVNFAFSYAVPAWALLLIFKKPWPQPTA